MQTDIQTVIKDEQSPKCIIVTEKDAQCRTTIHMIAAQYGIVDYVVETEEKPTHEVLTGNVIRYTDRKVRGAGLAYAG